MGILHGSWLAQGGFFVWGEIYRFSKREATPTPKKQSPKKQSLEETMSLVHPDVPLHPYNLHPGELVEFLEEKNLLTPAALKNAPITALVVHLPSYKSGRLTLPFLSSQEVTGDLQKPWKITGITLNLSLGKELLKALPLGNVAPGGDYWGGDLRFWSHVYRWSLDLLGREKFVPGVSTDDEQVVMGWLPLLDSALDQARLTRFTQAMPLICCQYQAQLLNQLPSEILLDFLAGSIDHHIRQIIADLPQPRLTTPLQEWVQGLTANHPGKNHLSPDSDAALRLTALWQNWTAPVQKSLVTSSNYWQQGQEQGDLFRVCLVLVPPEGENGWRLEYHLQAIDQPELLISAATIWHHDSERLVQHQRTIVAPRETLLRGLGIAARLYPLISNSLESPRPEFCELGDLEVYEFIKARAWQLEDHGLGVILPSSLRPGVEEKKLGLKITALEPNAGQRLGMQTLLNYRWELAIGDMTISTQEFQQILAMQSPLVQVNGTWIALQPGEMRSAQQLLTTPPSQTLSVADLLRLGSGETQVMEKLPVVSFEAQGVLEELLANLGRNEAIAPLDPPDTFQGQLRPYQARGLAWLAFLDRWGLGACLADDMGLGKTIQTIAFLLHLQHQQSLLNQATGDQSNQSLQISKSSQLLPSKQTKKSLSSHQPSLLLCPTSVLGNWEREVQKFAPTLRVRLHYGDKRSKGSNFAEAAQELDLIITSYPLMVRDWKTLHAVNWQVLILDEAQNIKNPDTKQSKAVRELKSQFRIALTGTPVENRLGELWSILDFLNPGYLGSRQFFQRRFALPIEKFGDRASLQVLRSLVQPLILRRLKTDRTIIQDLPEKQEMTVFCGLVPEQAALYQKLVDESLAEIDQLAGTKRNAMVLTLLMRLKQVCNHPAQYLKESISNQVNKSNQSNQFNQSELWQNFAQRSGKLKRLEEMLEELIAEGDSCLIFTQFAELGTLLQGYLTQQFQQEIFFFHGGTKKNDRELMVDRFQNDPNAPKVMILSLKAGGTGLNLTRANHVFHFDRWWNPAVENQATDRAFRIGQTRNVQVHKFVCTGTLEEKINNLINSKKQLAEQTVDVGESWLTELDTDQLRNLLVLDRSAIIDLE